MIQAPKPPLKNLLFIGILMLLFFTPLGKLLKVGVLQLISTSPSVEKVENRQEIIEYSGTITSENGQLIPFENYKNKPVIISFWATWCPSCIAEMPSLQKLYNDYKNSVSFLLVTNEQKEKVQAFMQQKNYDMPIFYNENNLPNLLHSKSIPATFLIAPNGEIVIKKIGVANWNSEQVRAVLNKIID